MLRALRVGNVALAADVSLELGPGLTMITGETGAGKSLIAGALSLLAGGPVDRGLIRTGEDEAFVEGVFDLDGDPAAEAACRRAGVGVAEDRILVLRREWRREGRSRVLINGGLSSQAVLESLAPSLLAVQSQDQQRLLSRRAYPRELLDRVLGLENDLSAVAETRRAWREAVRTRDRRRQEAAFGLEQLEIWRYQHEELTAAGLDPEEEADLRERLAVGRNARALMSAAGGAREALIEGETNARLLVARALASIEPHAGTSPRLQEIVSLLREAEAGVSEAGSVLGGFVDGLDLDEARLDEMESRLSLYQELARKYDRDTAGLLALQAELGDRLVRHEAADDELAELDRRCEETLAALSRAALAVRERRLAGAGGVAARAEALIRPLALPDLALEFAVEPALDEEGPVSVDGRACRVADHGVDDVRLIVRANRGESGGDVASVASGGERSRIFLGLSVLASDAQLRPLSLYDEIDAGLGMDNAVPVAELLDRLSADRQVLCITHLATVAVKGGTHLQVAKAERDGRTEVAVRKLDEEQRVAEVARLLGGEPAGEASPSVYARELLARG